MNTILLASYKTIGQQMPCAHFATKISLEQTCQCLIRERGIVMCILDIYLCSDSCKHTKMNRHEEPHSHLIKVFDFVQTM